MKETQPYSGIHHTSHAQWDCAAEIAFIERKCETQLKFFTKKIAGNGVVTSGEMKRNHEETEEWRVSRTKPQQAHA
jgi:hypothetical protein